MKKYNMWENRKVIAWSAHYEEAKAMLSIDRRLTDDTTNKLLDQEPNGMALEMAGVTVEVVDEEV